MTQLNPPERCDIVLEGGVTSAVIYAGLLATLAKTHSFMSLGGTSAGAVAAAAAAVAEASRRRLPPPQPGQRDPFDELGTLSARLAETDEFGRTQLFKLFQPAPAAQPGFRVIVALLRRGKPGQWGGAGVAALWAAVVAFRWAALAGLVIGLLPVASRWAELIACRAACANGASVAALGLGTLFALVLGGVAAVVWGALKTVRAALANHYGLCSGMPAEGQFGEALTPLLHRLYNGLAGRGPGDPPVTFAALWDAPNPDPERAGKRAIDLQMVTTALNLKRPLRLPNDPGVDPLRNFFYDPLEWAALFPAPVLKWLADHPRDAGSVRVMSRDGRPLRALPEPRDWPIVMTVRLSLSFPGLLSAVPMHALDGRRGVHPRPGVPGDVVFEADRVYFSDGGITNNCPIQLFDAPLPRWPTFGVNLWDMRGPPGADPQVWLSGDGNEPELRPHPFAAGGALGRAVGFAAIIVGTALDWRDSVQRALPGYRERIVHVGVPPNEGGLNLTMTADSIARLNKAGVRAARKLVAEFGAPRLGQQRPNGWELHRWLRMRSTLAATRRHLGLLRAGIDAGRPPYAQLAQAGPALAPRFVDPAAAEQAQALLAGASALVEAVDAAAADPPLGRNAPEPAPALRMSSPW